MRTINFISRAEGRTATGGGACAQELREALRDLGVSVAYSRDEADPSKVWLENDLCEFGTLTVGGGRFDQCFDISPPEFESTGDGVGEWVVDVLVEIVRLHDPDDPHRTTGAHDDVAFMLRHFGFGCRWEEASYFAEDNTNGHLSRWTTSVPGPDEVARLIGDLLELPLWLHERGDRTEYIGLSGDQAEDLVPMCAPEDPSPAAPTCPQGWARGSWTWLPPPCEVGAHRLVTPSGELAATVYPASGWHVWSPQGDAVKSGTSQPVDVAKRRARTAARTWWRRRGWLG